MSFEKKNLVFVDDRAEGNYISTSRGYYTWGSNYSQTGQKCPNPIPKLCPIPCPTEKKCENTIIISYVININQDAKGDITTTNTTRAIINNLIFIPCRKCCNGAGGSYKLDLGERNLDIIIEADGTVLVNGKRIDEVKNATQL